jgi:hypothetical protein
MSDEAEVFEQIKETAPKAKRRRRRGKYRFTGAGVRIINGNRIRHGDYCMLFPNEVTREYVKIDS